MIPRFFVSSTYYDLKHVRERLEKFIEAYGFEPILFESDKITYQHSRELDWSAYYEVELCHVMLLIVGGRYGSPSSNDKVSEQRKKYDKDYVSITRKEFETALEKNIPIFIFIDKNVYSEYQTYKENQQFLDGISDIPDPKKVNFRFAHVDHVNIFKFIDTIRSKPIKTFERVEEIESYLRTQLSGMFYLYLESLKKTANDNKILDTISELNNVTLRMNEMLTSVGKEILGKDQQEYEKVIENQLDILLGFFSDKFIANIKFEDNLSYGEVDSFDLEYIARLFFDESLNVDLPPIGGAKDWAEKYNKFNKDVLTKLQKELSIISGKIVLKSYDFRTLSADLKNKVLPFIKDDSDKQKLIDYLIVALKEALYELPF